MVCNAFLNSAPLNDKLMFQLVSCSTGGTLYSLDELLLEDELLEDDESLLLLLIASDELSELEYIDESALLDGTCGSPSSTLLVVFISLISLVVLISLFMLKMEKIKL